MRNTLATSRWVRSSSSNTVRETLSQPPGGYGHLLPILYEKHSRNLQVGTVIFFQYCTRNTLATSRWVRSSSSNTVRETLSQPPGGYGHLLPILYEKHSRNLQVGTVIFFQYCTRNTLATSRWVRSSSSNTVRETLSQPPGGYGHLLPILYEKHSRNLQVGTVIFFQYCTRNTLATSRWVRSSSSNTVRETLSQPPGGYGHLLPILYEKHSRNLQVGTVIFFQYCTRNTLATSRWVRSSSSNTVRETLSQPPGGYGHLLPILYEKHSRNLQVGTVIFFQYCTRNTLATSRWVRSSSSNTVRETLSQPPGGYGHLLPILYEKHSRNLQVGTVIFFQYCTRNTLATSRWVRSSSSNTVRETLSQPPGGYGHLLPILYEKHSRNLQVGTVIFFQYCTRNTLATSRWVRSSSSNTVRETLSQPPGGYGHLLPILYEKHSRNLQVGTVIFFQYCTRNTLATSRWVRSSSSNTVRETLSQPPGGYGHLLPILYEKHSRNLQVGTVIFFQYCTRNTLATSRWVRSSSSNTV